MKIEKKTLNEALKVLGKIVSQTSPVEVQKSIHFVGDTNGITAMATDAKQFVKNRDLVIFASQDMQSDKSRFYELLKFGLEHDISVIVFAAQPDLFVQRIAGRFYELNCRLDSNIMQYTFGSAGTGFGVNFSLTPQGQLTSCRDLGETEINELGTRQNTLQVENGMKFIGNLSDEQIRETMFGNRLV